MVEIPRGYRSVVELAQYVGVSPTTIQRWRRDGVIPLPAMVSESGMEYWTTEQAADIIQIRLNRMPYQKRAR